MSAGRRGLLLSVAFLGLALWLVPGRRATAQQPIQIQPTDPGTGRHTIWQHQLTSEQIRALLGRFGQDDGKGGDPFENMLRDLIRDRNPGADPRQVDAVVKQFMNDKEFRDRVTDLAQKQKNQMREKGNAGQPPPLAPQDRAKLEELAKQLKIRPDGKGGDPFKLPDGMFPKGNPDQFPPFDPRNPNFDPKKFPGIDPDNPPQFDRNTKFPLDPDTGKPFDPRDPDRRPIDPKNPPKIDPPPKIGQNPPRVEPPKVGPPKDDPNAVGPNNPDGKRKFDPNNPLGVPNDPPDKIAKTKAAEAATALWEKNVGPIEESPAVKKAILELVSDSDVMDALTDGKGNNFFEMLQNDGAGEKFDFFGGGDTGGWEWPKLDLGWLRNRDTDFDLPNRPPRERPSLPDRPRGGSSAPDGLGTFSLGGMTVPWVLMLVLLAIVAAAVLWWKWETLFKPAPAAVTAGGPGPWPIDPRGINTREDVVKAFEYLSVLICGPAAKTWTHSTIADELSALVATHGETAVKLARLYELARYAPLDEPLTRAELMEARRLVCDLAGMDE